jgi:hypothetical protein
VVQVSDVKVRAASSLMVVPEGMPLGFEQVIQLPFESHWTVVLRVVVQAKAGATVPKTRTTATAPSRVIFVIRPLPSIT